MDHTFNLVLRMHNIIISNITYMHTFVGFV